MIDLVAAKVGAVIKRMNGLTGTATILPLLSIVASTVVAFLQYGKSKVLPVFMHFVVPINILTHASARADFPFWISRKLLMLQVAVPTGASITIACGYASHAALAAVFGNVRHVLDQQTIAISISFTITMLLAYGASYYLYHNLQRRVPMLWELHRVHHSAEVMVGTTKDRIHPIDNMMNRVWVGLITELVYGFGFPLHSTLLNSPFWASTSMRCEISS